MKKQLFGTDGIRGKAKEYINYDLAYQVGKGIALKYQLEKIFIGHDTRESANDILKGLTDSLTKAGIDVYIGGVIPTPLVSLYSNKYQTISIMITASHNPYTDNGIKLFKNGEKLTDLEEIELEDYILNHEPLNSKKTGIIKKYNILDDYLLIYENLNIPNNHLKIAYDSANGANHQVSNLIINKYFNNSTQIGNKPNGLNINLNCGSTYLKTIKDLVKETKSDIGLSFDGDGDRILVVDENLNEVDGDLILYIIAKYLKDKNLLKNNTVVVTIMTNLGVIKALNDLGINVLITNVGDKNVYLKMKEENLNLGAENSGHIILSDFIKTGDGLLAGLYLIKVLLETKTNLTNYINEVKYFPQRLVNLKNINKEVLKTDKFLKFFEEIKTLLGQNSKLNIRPSGTENLIRITISHEDEEVLNKYLEIIINKLKEMGNYDE
ncbi:MAG: hypothetical protein WC907_02290 [Acholeplasmataceae bacterium]